MNVALPFRPMAKKQTETVNPRPIRLCYVIDNISFRGGERNFAQLALGLDRNQYELHVICSPGGKFVEMLTAAQIPIFPVNMRNKWDFTGLVAMVRYLRQNRFDIVHTQGRGDPFGRLAAWLAGVPYVISTTQMIVSRYWGAGLFRRLLYQAIDQVTNRLVDHYIVVNTESVETLVNDYGIPQGRVSLIRNGIEVERYAFSPAARYAWRSQWQLRDEHLVVGAIGKLTWQKGFEYLLRAWPELIAHVPNARLFILGEGELEHDLKALAAELQIQNTCTFTGFEPNVPQALAGMDLFILPSLVEGLPMVLLEAMAAGKPVIASQIPGTHDTITDGVDGMLIKPQDLPALTDAMVRLLSSPQRARQLGEAARQSIQHAFSVKRVITETARIYEAALPAQTRRQKVHPDTLATE